MNYSSQIPDYCINIITKKAEIMNIVQICDSVLNYKHINNTMLLRKICVAADFIVALNSDIL